MAKSEALAQDRVTVYEVEDVEAYVLNFSVRVYALAAVSIAITGIVGYYFFTSGLVMSLINDNDTVPRRSPSVIYWVVLLCLLASAAMLISFNHKISLLIAFTMYLCVSFFNGIIFSIFFISVPMNVLLSAFFFSAFVFLAASAYGFVTSDSPVNLRGTFCVALAAFIFSFLIDFFIGWTGSEGWVTRIISIIFLLPFISYQAQRTREVACDMIGRDDSDLEWKASLVLAVNIVACFLLLFSKIVNLLRGRYKPY